MKLPKPLHPREEKKIKNTLEKKAKVLWNKRCYEKYGVKCEACGAKKGDILSSGTRAKMEIHHFFPKGSFQWLKFEIENGIVLDHSCHFKHTHRGDPRIHEIIRNKRGTKWLARLTKKSFTSPGGSYLTIQYYENIIQRLKEAQDESVNL